MNGPALDLGQLGLSAADVSRSVDAELGIGAGDLLFACGSLVEGLGNSKSDLDLCLVSSSAPLGANEAGNRPVLVGGRLIADVLAVHPETLLELAGRLVRLHASGRDLRAAAKSFTFFEHRLLHRLLNSVPFLNHEGDAKTYARLRNALPPGHLERLKLDRAHYEAAALQLDLAGLRDERQWPAMVFVSQDLLGWAIDGLLAAHGYTNPTPKWRVKLLGRIEPSAIGKLPGYGDTEPVGLVMELNRAPEPVDSSTAIVQAARVACFARSVFLWAEQQLAGAPEIPNLFEAARARDPGECLPSLDIDVGFRPVGEAFELLRKNRSSGRLRLDREQASLACLFNGSTALAQARRSLGRLLGSTQGAQALESFTALLEGARLLIPPELDEQELEQLIGAAGSDGMPAMDRSEASACG